jgi:glycosyltransferase involved in cell wall biosynthesis
MSKKGKISMVTYADLGEMKNNKTPGALPILEKFEAEGELNQVICRRAKNPPFANTETALPVLAHWVIGGLGRVIPNSFNFPKRRLEEAVYDWQASRKLDPSDVVVFHPARFPQTMQKAINDDAILAGIGTVPHQAYGVGLEKEELEVLNEKRGKHNQWWASFSDNYKNFDYIFALSDFVKKTFVESGYPEDNIFITPTDIDTNRFSPLGIKDKGLTDNFDVVFVASSIWLLKGLQYLLEAWKQIDIPEARLHVFGRFGSIPANLQKRMNEQMTADNSIIRHGIVDNPENYMKRADAMVQPSLAEGLSKVLLESMACGLPTISTEHSRGIVQDGESGIVVPIRDPEAIAENIEMLYQDKTLREELGENARQAVLGKPSYAESVWEAYQEIIEREGLE